MTRSLRMGAAMALLAVAAWAVPAGVVAASFGLTTPYPAVEVSPGGSATFPLTVTTPSPERVGLAVVDAPSGWTTTIRGGGFIVTAVQTGDSTSTPPAVEVDVKVPQSATPGTYGVTVQATGLGGPISLPLQLTIAASGGGQVAMTADFPLLKGTASSSFTFTLTIANDTTQKTTFNLQGQGPDGWTVEAHPVSSSQAVTASVDAGGSTPISVIVTPPTSVAAGTYPITVSAAGGAQPVQTQLQVQITGSPHIKLSTPNGTLNAQVTAGGSGTFTVTAQNTGTVPLSGLTFSDTPPSGWKVDFAPAQIDTLAPNATQNVTVTVRPTSDALAGDYDLAISASAGTASDSLDIRTTVQTSPIWGLVGLVLIVLVLVGLAWVFRRYGRR